MLLLDDREKLPKAWCKLFLQYAKVQVALKEQVCGRVPSQQTLTKDLAHDSCDVWHQVNYKIRAASATAVDVQLPSQWRIIRDLINTFEIEITNIDVPSNCAGLRFGHITKLVYVFSR